MPETVASTSTTETTTTTTVVSVSQPRNRLDLIEEKIAIENDLDQWSTNSESESNTDTPSEDEEGKKVCRLFRDDKHYVTPAFKDTKFRNTFTAKLLILNIISYVPCVLVWLGINWLHFTLTKHEENKEFIRDFVIWGSILVVGLIVHFLYSFYVSLNRQRPRLQIFLVIKILITTVLYCSSMMLVDRLFVKTVLENEEKHEQEYTDDNNKFDDVETEEDESKTEPIPTPLFMALLNLTLFLIVQGIMILFLLRYQICLLDYKIPLVIYTVCIAVNVVLITVVLWLPNGFNTQPRYDAFQIYVGCLSASVMLMRLPDSAERLFEGKLCPLLQDELLYAFNHFGL